MRNYQAGRTTLCQNDFNLIRDWRADPNITVENADVLTVSGWDIMQNLATRYQQLFPTLLPTTYNRSRFLFRHTFRQRSQGSIRAFADGLFGPDGFQSVVFEPIPEQDTFLRVSIWQFTQTIAIIIILFILNFLKPNDFCPAFTLEGSSTEADAFTNGPEFRQAVTQVNAKLGFLGSNQLTTQQIRTLWDICRFEKNIDLSRPSPWCSAFSIANNEVFEYHADLEYFYLNGYGVRNRRLVENLNCGLVQDMLRYLQSSDPNEETARIYGTHSSVLHTFLVSLGVFEDENTLTRHNIGQSVNRQWRTSWLSPKGGNLAVVRYE